MSQLDRQRLRRNFLDRQDEAGRRIELQTRKTTTTDNQGRTYASALLLTVQAGVPEPPPEGKILLYAVVDAGDTYLRAMDADGTVIEIGDWS